MGNNGSNKTELFSVTPAMASRWLAVPPPPELEHMSKRSFSRAKGYARLMRDGLWNQGHPCPIVLHSSGYVMDGNNRLVAVMLSGVTTLFNVCFNTPAEVLDTIDSGKPRSSGDRITMSGVRNGNEVAAATTVLYFLLCASNNNKKLFFVELKEVFDRFQEQIMATTKVWPKLIAPGIPSGGAGVRAGLAYAMLSSLDVSEMIRAAVDGSAAKGSAAYALRAAIALASRGRGGGNERYALALQTVRACELHVTGAEVTLLRPSATVLDRVAPPLSVLADFRHDSTVAPKRETDPRAPIEPIASLLNRMARMD